MNVSDLTIDQLMALIAERQKLDAQEAADDPKKKKSSSTTRTQTEGKGTPSTSKVLDKEFANAETPAGSEEEPSDVGFVTDEKKPEDASDAESGDEKAPDDAEGAESGEDVPGEAYKKTGGNGQPPGDSGPEDSTSEEDTDSSDSDDEDENKAAKANSKAKKNSNGGSKTKPNPATANGQAGCNTAMQLNYKAAAAKFDLETKFKKPYDDFGSNRSLKIGDDPMRILKLSSAIRSDLNRTGVTAPALTLPDGNDALETMPQKEAGFNLQGRNMGTKAIELIHKYIVDNNLQKKGRFYKKL